MEAVRYQGTPAMITALASGELDIANIERLEQANPHSPKIVRIDVGDSDILSKFDPVFLCDRYLRSTSISVKRTAADRWRIFGLA